MLAQGEKMAALVSRSSRLVLRQYPLQMTGLPLLPIPASHFGRLGVPLVWFREKDDDYGRPIGLRGARDALPHVLDFRLRVLLQPVVELHFEGFIRVSCEHFRFHGPLCRPERLAGRAII